jgi:hypothetical protein
MPSTMFPLEQTIMIDDAYLANPGNPDIDLETFEPAIAFMNHRTSVSGHEVVDIPRGQNNGRIDVRAVKVNATTGPDVYGNINCRYKNDPHFHIENYIIGFTQYDRLRTIRCAGTTARGIIIKM